MPVLYGNYELRPVQGVTITQEDQTVGDGRQAGRTVRATINGTIVIEKIAGVYSPLPLSQRLSGILAKQAEIRNAFSTSGLLFEVQGWDGSPPTKFNARVLSVEFGDGIWTDVSNYTIQLEGVVINGESIAGEQYIESANESWLFERGENPQTTRVNHNLSAKGKLVYGSTGNIPTKPWEYAKAFVQNQLGLGYLTRTTQNWSPLSGSDLAAISASGPQSLTAWNRVVQETVDEMDGSYSVQETFLLNSNNFLDSYTVSARRVEDPHVSTQVSIQGTIQGLFVNLGEEATRYANALAQWNVVKTQLLVRAQTAAASVSGGILNPHPITFNVDHNQLEGTITYNAEFSDRQLINDTIEDYQISTRTSNEDYKTNVSIQGTIVGALYLDDDPSLAREARYQRVLTQWPLVQAVLFSRVVLASGVPDLKPFPVSAEFTKNEFEGTISYNYEFDNRNPENIRHEFNVTKRFSREDGRDIVSIEGTVTGIRQASPNDPFGTANPDERFTTAKTYFDGMSPGILGLASVRGVDITCINPNPYTSSVGYVPLNGSIQYSFEFNSLPNPVTPGALSEVINVSDEEGTAVIAIIPVLGRSQGPVIQDIGTIKEKRRTLNVEIVMTPVKYGCSTGGVKPNFDITPYVPSGKPVYKENDQTQWSANTGRYSRTVSWIYE